MIDTVKSATADGFVTKTLERREIFRVQTPQGFMLGDILSAHLSAAGQSLSDDAAVAESKGLKIKIVPGDFKNIKITYPSDIQQLRVEDGSSMTSIRVGSGFDVHRFGGGDMVTLCGVDIPFNRSLEATLTRMLDFTLTDALLGLWQSDISIFRRRTLVERCIVYIFLNTS